MKTTKKSGAATWASDALADLHRQIDAERDHERWLEMARTLGRVEDAIQEEHKVWVAAMAAEKMLANGEMLMPINNVSRELSRTRRNIKRRKAYVHTGRKPGRPRTYFTGIRRVGHHAFQTGGRGGKRHRVY